MAWLFKIIGSFVAPVIKAVLSWWAEEKRRPREVKFTGADPELDEEFQDQFEVSLREGEKENNEES